MVLVQVVVHIIVKYINLKGFEQNDRLTTNKDEWEVTILSESEGT